MRTREEIKSETTSYAIPSGQERNLDIAIEVLLDIRDLLANPPTRSNPLED